MIMCGCIVDHAMSDAWARGVDFIDHPMELDVRHETTMNPSYPTLAVGWGQDPMFSNRSSQWLTKLDDGRFTGNR